MNDEARLRRFADDLRIGRGPALQQARAAMDKEAYRPLVLAACAHHQAYDPQCEGTRTAYLLDALVAVGARDELRAIVLAGLPRAEDWDVGHFLDLAAVLAREGDDEARAAIVHHLETAPPSADAGAALIDIDGRAGLVDPDRGLLRVARVLGERLEPGDAWIGKSVHDEAIEIFGAEETERALDRGQATIQGVMRFRDILRAFEAESGPTNRAPPPSLPATFAQLWRSIEAEPPRPRNRRGWSKAAVWGRQAPESEIVLAAAAVRAEGDPLRLAVLLRVFRQRTWPGDIDPLVVLASSEHAHVTEGAIDALARRTGPEIREFAWSRLDRADPPWGVLRLFAGNALAGDGERLAERLASVEGDDDRRHHVVCCVLDAVPAALGPSEWRGPLLWAYEASPCSLCREHIVAKLVSADALPDELRQESRWDAREDTRALVTSRAGA